MCEGGTAAEGARRIERCVTSSAIVLHTRGKCPQYTLARRPKCTEAHSPHESQSPAVSLDSCWRLKASRSALTALTDFMAALPPALCSNLACRASACG